MIHFRILFCIKIIRIFRNYYNTAKIVKVLKAKLILLIAKITKINIKPANQGTIFALMKSVREQQFTVRSFTKMTHEYTHQPVILLLDGSPSTDNEFIKRWFQKSRFLTCEATNIFEALEEISDFTNFQRPDVVLLEVASMPDDFQVVKRMTQTHSGVSELLIFAFSESGKNVNDGDCFEGNLAQLEAKLNRLIPPCGETRRTIAA